MWGTSFEDLAKRAAEMQEQAAASMTSPVAPSFNMGGMFNMDALQQNDETNPDTKKDDLQQPQQQRQPQQQQQQQQHTASKLQQPQSFMSNMSMNMSNINVNNVMSMPSMASITPNNFSNNNNSNAQQTRIPKSFGTVNSRTTTPAMKTPAKNLFPASAKKSSLVMPKGKLGIPVKPTNNNNNSNVNAKANVKANANKMKKSAISGGNNTLKINKPASSLLAKIPAIAGGNNNKQGGGLVIGTTQNQSSKPAIAATTSNPAPATKQTQSTTEPTTAAAAVVTTTMMMTTSTTSKLVAPKPIAKQQSSAEPSKQQLPQPLTSATVAQPKGSQKPQQQQQQQSTAATITHTAVPKKGPEVIKPEPVLPTPSSTPNKTTTKAASAVTAEKYDKQEEKGSGKPPISPGGGRTEPTATSNAANESSTQNDTSPSASLPLSAAPGKNEDILREKLQHQQEEFEKQLDQQRQQLEGRMQQLQQQFSNQLQRLEEHHKNETETTNAQHEASLVHWQQQVRDREMVLESQSKSSQINDTNSKAMVQKLSSDLKQARELIADKKVEDLKLQEAHLQQLRDMEKQCFKKEDASNSLEQEMKNLEKKLEESNKETQNALDDYNKLKGRAKSVAGELKERRAECRTLSSEIDLLERSKKSLQDRVTELEATGMDMNQSSEETQSKLENLQSSLDETKQELEEARVSFEQDKKKVEDSLSNYKKKAQQSLALANARSASAVQAREEAEMEARAARSTADTAMERAMKSEFNGKQALAEAKVYVDQMKGEVGKYESVKTKLEEASKELKQAQTEAETNKESSEKLRCELTSLSGRLEAEHTTVQDQKESLTDAQNRSNELYDEVERLRNGSRMLQAEIKRITEASKTAADSSFASEKEQAAIVRGANAEAEATIAMLQQELQDSNRAIKDLKETLKATMEEKEDSFRESGGYPNGGSGTMNGNRQQSETNGMPLYYAMEKQAELAQARDEIARMANLLGDAESSKQDAFDEMYIMKRLMEDAQSKLQRQEQFQTNEGMGEEKSLNLEYLKNVVLSYLNAESVQEKKALLPVIGTVLCLTQAEQSKAIEQLDRGSGSMMDSVATSVLGLKWS